MKAIKYILVLVLVVTMLVVGIIASPVFAGKGSPPGNWSALANMPANVEGMAVGGVGDTIVAACGYQGGVDTNLVRLYNIATNTWSFGTPAPTGRAEVAYGELTHGGKLYVIGGRTLGKGNLIECYDVSSDSWTTLAPMPTARAAAVAVVVGNSVYVIGGRTGASPRSGTALTAVERYDIDKDMWIAVAPLPKPRSDFAGVAHGGNIYIFGGWNQTDGTIADVNVYDPVKDTWAPLTPMPQARDVHMAGKVGNLAYVFGGRDPGTGLVSGVNQVYNLVKDSWTTDTSMTAGKEVGETGVYSHGGKVYVVGGGRPAFGTATNFTQVFKP
jgi:N-acetylneuraminic acid mutarotase